MIAHARFTGADPWRRCLAVWRAALRRMPVPRRVLVVGPDITRLHSGAQPLVQALHRLWRHTAFDILPALGTHRPMDQRQLALLYGTFDERVRYLCHDWRRGTVWVATLRAATIAATLGRAVAGNWPVRINRALFDRRYDLRLSIGQVAPHEVVGMSNYTKNIIIGLGGRESIDLTHYWSALCGLDDMIGRTITPLRLLLQQVADRYLADLHIHYALTVMHPPAVPYALAVGDTIDAFYQAAQYSRQVHTISLPRPPRTAVVYLDPHKYRSLWLANKAIYRLRRVIAPGGQLIIVAAVECYAEDLAIDRVIARHGYGDAALLQRIIARRRPPLHAAAIAHLIHSQSGPITVRYALRREQERFITAVGFGFIAVDHVRRQYGPFNKPPGWYRSAAGDEYYFATDPGCYTWAVAGAAA